MIPQSGMKNLYSTRFIAYDTICTVSLIASDPKEAGNVLQSVRTLALEVERTLNMYDPMSEMSALCSSYKVGVPYPVSTMLESFIAMNLSFSQKTSGAFDFSVGPLVKEWNFSPQIQKIPTLEQLRAHQSAVGYQKICLDTTAHTVVFEAADMVLDPGASGKGFALKLCVQALRDSGIEQACLDFGGNLYALGNKPDGSAWRAAIRHPRGGILGVVPIVDRGVATSSWFEHGFVRAGQMYHHLLDPTTGMPRKSDISSISVLSSRAEYTDLLSTAFFILGQNDGDRLLKCLRAEGIDVDYVLLGNDGRIIATPGSTFTEMKIDK